VISSVLVAGDVDRRQSFDFEGFERPETIHEQELSN
jgi:hypothetical protein